MVGVNSNYSSFGLPQNPSSMATTTYGAIYISSVPIGQEKIQHLVLEHRPVIDGGFTHPGQGF